MRFTEQHQVERPGEADWFDLNVEMDSPLYVDPFLVFADTGADWSSAHDEVVDFFDAVLVMLRLADGHRDSLHWQKAERFLLFPEPKEFALGLAMGHPEGSGIGRELAHEMCEGLEFLRVRGRSADERLLAMMAILVGGLGVDRISDMICNILKSRFISYTQAVSEGLGVSLQEIPVTNTSWAAHDCRWSSTKQMLPPSPVFNGAVILTPQRFLKDIPRVTPEGFWSWAEINAGETLRFDLNYDLTLSLDAREKARLGRELAHKAVDLLEAYIDQAAQDPTAYDVANDPKGIVRWEEAGRRIARASAVPPAPLTQDDFEDWLLAMAQTFKTAVEDGGLWVALWDDAKTKHRRETIAQVIARAAWIEHARAQDIDITREADCGRGPVDFKFSRGWTMRGLIEVKHIESSQFAHGAETQLPTYLKGEQAPFGIYLCIGYRDKDFDDDRLKLVRDACTAISVDGKTQIVPIFVDARPKPSASKA
jgi:hypothetical protein